MRYFAVVVMILALVGCETTDPYTGERKTSNSTKGAAIGAAVGAVLGAVINHDDRKQGALVGAALGGITGGGVGNYMDQQESALRERLRRSGVSVVREGDNIRLVMPGNITFATGDANIRADFYEVLNSVGLVLKEFDQTYIEISGHTDSTGSAQFNQRLSEQRASSVSRYLISQGISGGRISAVGYGFRYPAASNSTEEGRQLNRRVELELRPIVRQ